MPLLPSVTLDELVCSIRRQSQGHSRGSSLYRGVSGASGRWEARLGLPGRAHMYLGLHENEEEAARAVDRALLQVRGPQATGLNFNSSDYGACLTYERSRRVAPAPPTCLSVLSS